MTAVYCLQYQSMNVLIPKRRGKGYCKSVFGYHSTNDACNKFDSLRDYGETPFRWFAGDTCDIDGYLAIDTKVYSWEGKYKEGVELTINALKKCFPFVTDFKQLNADDFFNLIK